jgi:predicted Rossmann fold nucleotide-binding protein DprA/Smf involved in DNA uptake
MLMANDSIRRAMSQSAGCHTIIRDLSAILVTSVDDIIAASLRPQATDRAA